MALEDSISVARLKNVGTALAIIALYALLLAPGLILTAYIGGWGLLLVGLTAALLYPATGLLADGVVHRRRERAAEEVARAAHALQVHFPYYRATKFDEAEDKGGAGRGY